MESFDELLGIARGELDAESQAKAARQEQEEKETRRRNEARSQTEALKQAIAVEVVAVAEAMSRKKGTETFQAVSADEASKSRKKFWEPAKPGTANRTPQQIQSRENRQRAYLEQRSFPVWDLGLEWSETGPNEPWEAYTQHYLLSSDGTIFYASHFNPEEAKNGVVPLREFDISSGDETKLGTIRLGLARLVAGNNLPVDL